MVRYFWDDHSCKISRRSAQWAASDRGWLFSTDPATHTSLGWYLDYAGTSSGDKPEGTILACVVGKSASGWFPTVEAAKAFILAEVGLDPSRVTSRLARVERRRRALGVILAARSLT